jgi:isoleucyl-tRNA synthetase
VRISNDILKQLSEVYRKIRNTARYILGSLADFNPDTDSVTDLEEIDRYILLRLNQLVAKVTASYEKYEYHILYHAIHNFCVVELSNFYLDVIKDRTYCEKADAKVRRSSQTAMYTVLDALVRLIAPVLAFTAEEIWQFMPHRASDSAESVWFTLFPEPTDKYDVPGLEEKWEKILSVRDEAAKALEIARTAKIIGHSLGANVTLYADETRYDFLRSIEGDLPAILITSSASVARIEDAPADAYTAENLDGVKILVTVPAGAKCARCWMYSPHVTEENGELCERCAEVVSCISK